MYLIKSVILGIFSFLLIFFVFIRDYSISLNTIKSAFPIVIFSLMSFISVYSLLINKSKKEIRELNTKSILHPIVLFAVVILGFSVLSIIFTQSNNKRQVNKEKSIEASQNYNDSMKKVVQNIELLEPSFSIITSEELTVSELLIQFPLIIGPKAKETSLTKLRVPYIGQYYGFSFSKLEEYTKRSADSSFRYSPCGKGNTFIRFGDTRIHYINELSLTDTNPNYYVSMYILGEDCTPDILSKRLIGETLYIYRVAPDGNKLLYKSYLIEDIEL